MAIGFDLDGVLTQLGLYNNDTKLPWWCGLWLALVPPNKKMTRNLRKCFEDGQSIIIISARHKQLENMTRWWLKIHGVPFTRLVLVNPGKNVAEKKLAVIRELDISTFIDDDTCTVDFLKKADVDVVLYKGASYRR